MDRKLQGSFTVFFSLILVVILLFYMVLFSMSRHYLAIVHGRRALDSAAVAVLAGYNEELAEQYGLMGVENEEQIQSSLSYFLHQNYKLDAARLARGGGSDGGIQYQLLQLEVRDVQTISEVEEFLRQLEQFMKIRAPLAIIQELTSNWEDAGMAVTGGGLLDEVQKIQEKALVYNGHFAEFVSWADGIRDDGSRRRHYIKNFPGEGWDVNEITDSLGQLISQWETYGIIPLNTDIKLVKWIGRVESYVEVHKNAKEAWSETIRLGKELAAEIQDLRSRIQAMKPEEQSQDLVKQVQAQMDELESSLHQGKGSDEQVTQAIEHNMKLLQNCEDSFKRLRDTIWRLSEELEVCAQTAGQRARELSQYQSEIPLEYEIRSGNAGWSWEDILEALNLHVIDLSQYAPNSILLDKEDIRYQQLPSVMDGGNTVGQQEGDSILMEPDNLAQTAELIGGSLLRRVYLTEYTIGQLANLEETISRENGESPTNLRGMVKQNGFFANEVEYILNGSMNEYNNAWAVKGRLLFIRTTLNMLYLSTDAEKQQIIHSVADTVGGILAPGIGNAVLYGAIILLWSIGEACADYNCLLEGGKVPIFKTAEDWKTDLASILDKQLDTDTDKGARGLGYGQYLRLLLLWLDERQWVLRLQDVIQLNLEKSTGKPFRLSSVVTGFGAAGKMGADGREYEFAGNYGYG